MSVRIGDQVLQLAEDYGAAIDVLGDQMAANTTAAARSSLNALLGKLRRAYLRFLDEGTPSSTTAQGAPRRPLEYTIRETTARYADLLKISEEFLPDAEIKALEKVYRKDLAAAIGKGGELQAQLASLVDRRRATPFAGPDPQVVKAAAERTSAFIRGVSVEFRESLTRITLDGVAQGRGYKALTKDIRQLLGGPGFQQRAELIARSELANAYVQAQKQYAQAGGYRYVRWIAVGDERTCATCGSRSGRIFRTDEVSGTAHPRCRCVLAAVPNEAVEEQDPELRAVLSDQAFWEQHQKEAAETLQKSLGWDVSQVEAKIRQNLTKPTASERRLYPDIKRSAQPVG